jgi:glycosyltransferase 2 family protein
MGSAVVRRRRRMRMTDNDLWSRRPMDVMALGVGLAVLAAGMIVVRDGSVGGPEEEVFEVVNGLPEGLYPLIWPFQQLGALGVAPVIVIIAFATHHRRLAVAVSVVTVAKLVLERIVKMIVSRERPGTSIGPDAHLRGDVHVDGLSFVSGHAILVGALAGVITPYLRGRWKIVPWLLAGGVAFGRVYVGAHNPLDVLCGLGLGVAIAGVANLVLGVPHADHDRGPA